MNIILNMQRMDLDSTGTFKRTYELARERIGRENANYYKAIEQNNVKVFSNL